MRERPDFRPRRNKTLHVVGLSLAVAVPLFVILFSCVLFAPALSRPNAKCPACGREFRISDRHRGDMSALSVEYACPRCNTASPAVVLYRLSDESRP